MTNPKERPDEYRAVVQQVIKDGKHGPYAVATSDQIPGSITFSLDSEVWKEKEYPRSGYVVILSDVRNKRAGWRAHSARFVRPTDEQPQADSAMSKEK